MKEVKERKRGRKGAGKRPVIGAVVTHEERDLLQAIADSQGVKKSDVVRTALEGWLRRNKHLAAPQTQTSE